MELFFLLTYFWSKNLFYKIFSIQPEESKTSFRNRKHNYWNRKWNYFSYLLTSDQKTSFTKYFPFNLKSPKPVLETGNRIIKTGNGIIFPTYLLLIKKLIIQNIFCSTQRVQKQIIKTGNQIIETGTGIFFLLTDLWSKNLFHKIFSR